MPVLLSDMFLMRLLRIFTILFTACGLIACAATLTKQQMASIQTVTVVNHFPDFPTLADVSVSLAPSSHPTINDHAFRNYLSQQLVNRLQQRGYQVVIADSSGASGQQEAAELLVEIMPDTVEELLESDAYGFYHRSLLGLTGFTSSYISLTLVTTLNGQQICSDCRGESVTTLDIHALPDNWIELGRADKQALQQALYRDIEQAVDQAFAQTGL